MTEFHITREHHLNHMTKVVPFIFFIYGIQSYFLLHLSQRSMGGTLMWLGVCLSVLIASILTYDLSHRLVVSKDSFFVGYTFFGLKQFALVDVLDVKIISNQGSFASVVIELTNNRTVHAFFIDDAEKLQKILLQNKFNSQDMAA